MKTRTLFLLIALIGNVYSYGQIMLNEFNSKKGFIDEYGEDEDWVEIFNTSTDSIDLGQYYLSDNPSNLDKWAFPKIVLPPNEIFLICASGREEMVYPNHWESLVKAENIWRYWSGTNTPPANYSQWNELGYNDQGWPQGQGSIGYGDNDDNTIIGPTPSILMRREFVVNDLEDITHLIVQADYDDGFIAYLNGVEVMRSTNIIGTPQYNDFTSIDREAEMYSGGSPESLVIGREDAMDLLQTGTNVLAVRVHNASANSSDLTSKFFLTAGIASSNYAYQTLPTWFNPPLVFPHADFKLSGEETLVISDSNSAIVDSMRIPENLVRSISLGRSPDGFGNWCYFSTPSPNATNDQSTCYTHIVEDPIIDLPSGFYSSSNQVYISTSPGASSYYTTNGDIPDENDNMVNGPILVTQTSVLSVRSFSNNGQALPSNTVDRTYIIDEDNHDLPVISIITDEDNLWDWNTGIYVMGPGASTTYPYFGSNFWQPWSRKSRMEYFDKTKSKQFDAEVDLEIHGGWSRAEPQKSFRIDAKSIYTGDIEYPLIEGKSHIQSYNNFNLRNGGQHGITNRIQDAVMSRLADGTHIDRMGYEACIVYLNGQHWGLYGIREKMDEHYIESNHGIDKDKVDLLNPYGALVGSTYHFDESYNLLMNTSASNSSFMELFESRFDIANYIDYFVFQTYIQNRDWLGIDWGLNNTKLWRPDTTGGKWRYMMYDTDFAFGLYGGNIYQNYINLARNPSYPNQHSQLFNRVLNNQEFKCRFTNRYDDLINTTFQAVNFNTTTDVLKTTLGPAIPDHVTTWSSQMGPYSYSYWLNSVNGLKTYNSGRIATARQHLDQSLSLSGQRTVTLNVYPENSGLVKLNSIIPGLPWSGVYHGACPISAVATPTFGHIFSHWYSDNNSYNNSDQDSIQVNLNSNTELIAHFERCEDMISLGILEFDKQLVGQLSEPFSAIEYTWMLNGTIVSNDSVLYNPVNGTYQLVVRFDSCEISSTPLTVNNESYSLFVFPNPANDVIRVQFVHDNTENMRLAIFNVNGELVWEENKDGFVGQYNESIDISALSNGLYVFRAWTDSISYAERFLKIDQ